MTFTRSEEPRPWRSGETFQVPAKLRVALASSTHMRTRPPPHVALQHRLRFELVALLLVGMNGQTSLVPGFTCGGCQVLLQCLCLSGRRANCFGCANGGQMVAMELSHYGPPWVADCANLAHDRRGPGCRLECYCGWLASASTAGFERGSSGEGDDFPTFRGYVSFAGSAFLSICRLKARDSVTKERSFSIREESRARSL